MPRINDRIEGESYAITMTIEELKLLLRLAEAHYQAIERGNTYSRSRIQPEDKRTIRNFINWELRSKTIAAMYNEEGLHNARV